MLAAQAVGLKRSAGRGDRLRRRGFLVRFVRFFIFLCFTDRAPFFVIEAMGATAGMAEHTLFQAGFTTVITADFTAGRTVVAK